MGRSFLTTHPAASVSTPLIAFINPGGPQRYTSVSLSGAGIESETILGVTQPFSKANPAGLSSVGLATTYLTVNCHAGGTRK